MSAVPAADGNDRYQVNPYQSGTTPTSEVVERKSSFAVASIVMAGVSAASVAVFFAVILANLSRVNSGQMPSFTLMMSIVAVWTLCALGGLVLGGIGLLPRYRRRGLALFGVAANLSLSLFLVFLYLTGKAMANS